MLQRGRRLVCSAFALLVIAAAGAPGAAAADVKPLKGEWWFPAWGVDDLLWPESKGKGVTVGLVDSGVEAGLPDLKGVVLPGIDAENGSGDGLTDTKREGGHGTAMASLIAGQGRATGMVGVAPDAKILSVVAQSTDAYAKGIRYVVDHGATVVNLSQAVPGPCPADLQRSIAHALDKNAIVVAGAGNDGDGANSSNSPANCKGVVAVGAIDTASRPWEKSQRQDYVTLAAPGVRTVALGNDGRLYGGSGTSDATALTSGVIAVLRAKFPEMSNRELVRRLIASALDVDDKGRDKRTGFGVVRPNRVLTGKVPKGTANPVFEDYDRWAKRNKKAAAEPVEKPDSGGIGTGDVIGYAAIVAVGLGICVFAFFFARRKKGGPPGPPAPGTGFGPGVPPGFGQTRPPAQPGVPQGQPPHYQPQAPAQPWQPPGDGAPPQPPAR
ncbi:S8 family serine peptidase [Actinomadura graeca]|uniref:S8 family serine peptidase n=1 Tax=Actinomadura graeca TaxID=2750812 RepID=A0ABX8QYQ1_9ACTN|nr:S8 family serine peptidase [Actinomadura graeca]QXJ23961.1 S8 family serine peptidase [Actinomadura graeca]